jgi:GTP1/Obg family GTP-binding protein
MITREALFNHISKLKNQLETQINFNQNIIKDNAKKYSQLKREYDDLHEMYIDLINRRRQ